MTRLVSAVACMRLLGRPRAPPRNAHSIAAAHSGDLTPRITRRPAPLPKMRACVSAVACMRLLGGVQVPLKPERGASASSPTGLLVQLIPGAIPPHNAAHHAPAHKPAFDDIIRVAGRVHALVRLRPPLAHLPSPTSYATTSHQRHARRYRLAPQSGRPPRPPTLQAHCCATRRVYAFNQQNVYIATAI
jgi:hypothetical protein